MEIKRTSLMSGKKFLFVSGGILLGTVLLIILTITLLGSNEKELKSNLKAMAQSFYEEYYYDSLKKNYKNDEAGFKDTLENYKDQGFKIDLDNLSRVNDNGNKIELFVNSKTKQACDTKNTYVRIYPKEKYEKKDYNIEINLDCGFNEKK